MKERPILLTGDMVCAILEGRKTQTRRVVKRQPDIPDGWTFRARPREGYAVRVNPNGLASDPTVDAKRFRCPYGQPGDRLWVRETFTLGHIIDRPKQPIIAAYHNADGSRGYERKMHPGAPEGSDSWALQWKKVPSIHMPRWASRLTLEITGVRVERVQEISWQDAKAEGAGDFLARREGGGYFPTSASCHRLPFEA